MTKRKYWTLLERTPGQLFTPQFGDYDRSVVAQEERDMRDSGSFVKGTQFMIVCTDGSQKALTAKVEQANDEVCREIARGGIDRNLGDVCDGDDSADSIFDEAYTIAFDTLHDAGIDDAKARTIAQEIAQGIAQP